MLNGDDEPIAEPVHGHGRRELVRGNFWNDPKALNGDPMAPGQRNRLRAT